MQQEWHHSHCDVTAVTAVKYEFLLFWIKHTSWHLHGEMAHHLYGKLESGSPWDLQQFPRIIYKISGSRKMALDPVRSTEKAGSLARPPLVIESGGKHV